MAPWLKTLPYMINMCAKFQTSLQNVRENVTFVTL